MTHNEFINQTIEMIKQCQCDDFYNELGFKLKIEKNNIKSVTITAQVLLIFEQLFGKNFMFNNRIRGEFDFGKIIKYLKRVKDDFINFNKDNYSKFNVCRCAYCGIALSLLKEENDAIEIADFLCMNKISNEYAWGINLFGNIPDILSTYVVTMLLNRLHKDFSRPSFLDDLLNEYNNNGIPYNSERKEYKYLEALTLVLYMDKFYYFKAIEEEKIKLINGYYYNGIDSICNAKESYFKEHPTNQWRIYGFGLAANTIHDLNNPFYEYILEDLTRYFDKTETNIPYVLEICRMYNAIKRNTDPFHKDRILHEINNLNMDTHIEISNLKEKLDLLETKISNLNKYNREITIKIPIATAFICMYFIIFGFTIYLFLKTFSLKILKIKDFNDLYIVIDLGLSVIIPTIVFVFKKTRMIIINLVDRFYKKFNIIRTNTHTSESKTDNNQ